MMEQEVTGIIQARMNSTRLPGKVLREVMGRPLLGYQLERLLLCRNIKEIIVATTTHVQDDGIVMLAKQEGVKVYRGSENDVLDRYYQAATLFNCNHVMRITGDCPLIQPSYCDAAIEKYFSCQVDYFRSGNSLAEGLDIEIFSLAVLEQAWKNATLPSEREHVSLFLVNHSEQFNIYTEEYHPNDSHIRVTVDEPEDFVVVKEILEFLYPSWKGTFGIDEIRNFLSTHPAVYKKNQHIVRNEGLLLSLQRELSS